MQEYHFIYRDRRGHCVTKVHLFENDREALDAGSLTFENFSVQITRDTAVVGAFGAGSIRETVLGAFVTT